MPDIYRLGEGLISYTRDALNCLDSQGHRSPDEFHYRFDHDGRILEAAFAQTPSNNTPDASGYYDGHLAQTRARAEYAYDLAGRMLSVSHILGYAQFGWEWLQLGSDSCSSL